MKKNTRFVCLLLFTLFTSAGIAQETDGMKFQEEYRIHIRRITDSVIIDGKLTENTWFQAEKTGNFWQRYPQDESKAFRSTEVSAAYDNEYIYFAFTCYDTSFQVIQTLKRDTRFWESDGIAILIDPVNQRTNGFLFGLNADNAQSEDFISANSSSEINFSWDVKWLSATTKMKDRWIAEIAIPFKSLKFAKGKTTWGINFLRNDLKRNEYNNWTHVPIYINATDLGYTGALVWDQPPPSQGPNIAILPYATVTSSEIRYNGLGPVSTPTITNDLNGGFDAKIGVSNTMNLDLTVNPDFSQVEVDRQVTNLTRFNIFFPERRNFFLENSDLFSEFGIPNIRPFFSRTIGLDPNGNTIPIIGGLRLSGNLTKNLRIGVMNMQTGKKANTNSALEQGFGAQNYTAVAFHQRVFSRSLIKGYFLNREGSKDSNILKTNPMASYGRNAGLEFNFQNKSGSWNAWVGQHFSIKPVITGADQGYFNVGAAYSRSNFYSIVNLDVLGTNYYADMGFLGRVESLDASKDSVIRMGYTAIYFESEFRKFPRKGAVNGHFPGIENNLYFNPDGSLNERFNRLRYNISFRNTGAIKFRLDNQQVNLLFPAYITSVTDPPMPAGNYQFTQGEIEFSTDTRKSIAFDGAVRAGGFYSGTIQQYRAGITFRNQPWVNITMRAELNDIRMDKPQYNSYLTLISSQVQVNFSTKAFWSTFFQYNTQRDNFNINSRFQYRFKPMCDLYVVYTDNYFVDGNSVGKRFVFLETNKNRALVVKLNYWFNL